MPPCGSDVRLSQFHTPWSVNKPRPTRTTFRMLELPPSSGHPISFHVISQQHALLLACCSILMPSRDRGSTWQHGFGPEGKIRGRWGQFAIPVSVPQTRSPSLCSGCSEHVARHHVCIGCVTLVNVTGFMVFCKCTAV